MIKFILTGLFVLCLLNISAYASPAGNSHRRYKKVKDPHEDGSESDSPAVPPDAVWRSIYRKYKKNTSLSGQVRA